MVTLVAGRIRISRKFLATVKLRLVRRSRRTVFAGSPATDGTTMASSSPQGAVAHQGPRRCRRRWCRP